MWQRFTIGLIFLVAISVVLPAPRARADFKVDINPTSFNWQLDPGSLLEDTLTITNPGSTQINVNLQIFQFSVEDNIEDASPVLDEKNLNPYAGLVTIETNPSQFHLESHEQRLVKVRLKAKPNTSPGTYQLAIQAIVSTASSTTTPEAKDAPIVVGQETVSKLIVPAIILVNGKVNLKGEIQSFSTDKTTYPDGPVIYKLVFRNTGLVHYQAKATIFIYHNGQEVDKITVEPKIVLPNRSRSIVYKWDKHFLDSGLYDVRAIVNYGTKFQESATARTGFRIVSNNVLKIIFPIGAGLIGMYILLLLLGPKKRKRRR